MILESNVHQVLIGHLRSADSLRSLLQTSKEFSIFYIFLHWLIAGTDGRICAAGTTRTIMFSRYLLWPMRPGMGDCSIGFLSAGYDFSEKNAGMIWIGSGKLLPDFERIRNSMRQSC